MSENGTFCAIHPEAAAVASCPRCGSFMCAACIDPRHLNDCPSCRFQAAPVAAKAGLSRERFDFGAVWDSAFTLWKTNWLVLSAGILLIGAVIGVFTFFSQLVQALVMGLSGLGGSGDGDTSLRGLALVAAGGILSILLAMVQNIAQGVLTIGFFRMVADGLEGNAVDFSRMFSRLHRVGTLIGISLILFAVVLVPVGLLGVGAAVAIPLFRNTHVDSSAIAAGVGGLACLLAGPLTWLVLPLYFMNIELAVSDDGAVAVLRTLYRSLSGFRLWSILAMLASVPLLALGLLAFCVGLLPAAALSSCLLASFYLAIRKPLESRGA